jgi:predicted nucleic acid-binding protein
VITAVDSSVILSIYKNEPTGILWLETLIALRKTSRLVVCEIVVAETRPAVATETEHLASLTKLGLHYLPTTFETACRAGQMLQSYRTTGGSRERVIADFLVGAHALLQTDQLATDDLGFMRKYYESLPLLSLPKSV